MLLSHFYALYVKPHHKQIYYNLSFLEDVGNKFPVDVASGSF